VQSTRARSYKQNCEKKTFQENLENPCLRKYVKNIRERM
jgi:hypothetical protein